MIVIVLFVDEAKERLGIGLLKCTRKSTAKVGTPLHGFTGEANKMKWFLTWEQSRQKSF